VDANARRDRHDQQDHGDNADENGQRAPVVVIETRRNNGCDKTYDQCGDLTLQGLAERTLEVPQ
jgi:hypothetical protein